MSKDPIGTPRDPQGDALRDHGERIAKLEKDILEVIAKIKEVRGRAPEYPGDPQPDHRKR